MRKNLHRTFKTRNKRQDQTKEQKQLALVNYATENENRCCQESRYRNKIFYCSNAACCIFVHSNSERFNFNWNGARIDPPSFSGDVYKSTPLVPFCPPISAPPVSSSVEQQLQLQQPTSVTPVVSVQSLMSQSHSSPFRAVNTSLSSVYVPSLMHQLPFTGGQGQFMPSGRNQPSSQSTADQISADSSALL